MKSERAEAYINANEMDAAYLVDKDGCGWAVIGIHQARKAVELAEQEAEERVYEKLRRLCMKTLREVAEALCPIRLGEDYDKTIYNMIDKACHNEWIDGFITGAQWREDNPVAADSASDPESDSIELCGLLWDTENLAIGGYEKDGRHYYTWPKAIDAARSVGKRLPTREEFRVLCNLNSTWDDERRGRWFGGNHDSDHKGSLFLPAAGLRSNSSGELANTSSCGYYWSSSPYYGGDNSAGNLYLGPGNVSSIHFSNRAYGFSVRCVRDK